MRVLSICVGRPREVQSHGQTVLSSIMKSPVTGPVIVKTLNLEGDQQSDLTVHDDRRLARGHHARRRSAAHRLIKRFLRSGRSGFYLAVAEQGIIRAGDTVTRVSRESDAPTVAEAFHARRERSAAP